MVCANCGEKSPCPERADGKLCPACGVDSRLDGRYRLEEIVGQGALAITYRATRIDDGREVCVKELRYRGLGSFEPEELFRREVRVLRQLRHPAIPAHIDDFTTGAGKTLGLCMVQELVRGRNLATEMETRRYTDFEVLAIIEEMLDVLEYLHGLNPPVIHRDLKPSNIMRREEDGRLILVDFGSVRDVLTDPVLGGKTVAGTFGYMAPEQFAGKAYPATDLYGLGVTAVVLLSQRKAESLIDERNRLAWQEALHVQPRTRAILERLLEPDHHRRAQNAAEVRGLLKARPQERPRSEAPAVATKPASQPPSRPETPAERKRMAVISAAVVVALFSGMIGLIAFSPPRRRGATPGPAATAVVGGAITDVPECKAYFAAMESCLTKMPPEAREAMTAGFKAAREALTQAATNPNARDALATTCQAQLNATAQVPYCK